MNYDPAPVVITAKISLIKLKLLIDGMDCSQPRSYNSGGGQTTLTPNWS